MYFAIENTRTHVQARVRNNLCEVLKALEALFFNIVLEKVIRESNVETSAKIFQKVVSQLLCYADDLIGREILTSSMKISLKLKRRKPSSVSKSVRTSACT